MSLQIGFLNNLLQHLYVRSALPTQYRKYGKLPVTGKVISVVGSVELLVDIGFPYFSIAGKEELYDVGEKGYYLPLLINFKNKNKNN